MSADSLTKRSPQISSSSSSLRTTSPRRSTQVAQDVEGLRLEPHLDAVAAEDEPRQVELAVLEGKDQRKTSSNAVGLCCAPIGPLRPRTIRPAGSTSRTDARTARFAPGAGPDAANRPIQRAERAE